MSPAVGRLEANAKKGFRCRDDLGIKKFQTSHQFNSLGNGFLTAPWVMTALANRFLIMASLLPKEVYCRSRSKQSTFSATFPHLNSTKYTTNLRLCLAGPKHQMRKIVYKLLLLPDK